MTRSAGHLKKGEDAALTCTRFGGRKRERTYIKIGAAKTKKSFSVEEAPGERRRFWTRTKRKARKEPHGALPSGSKEARKMGRSIYRKKGKARLNSLRPGMMQRPIRVKRRGGKGASKRSVTVEIPIA